VESIELVQVLPRVEKEDRTLEGLDITTAQQCNRMAEEVTGQTSVDLKLDEQKELAIILDQVKGWRDHLTLDRKKWGKWVEKLKEMTLKGARGEVSKKEYQEFLDEIVVEFENKKVKKPRELDAVIKSLRMNQHIAAPRPGDVLATAGSMTQAQVADKRSKNQEFFLYHFGGVVAASSDDYITMENYAREAGKGISSGDPLFFFKMYGPQRTWHDAQLATGSFSGAVISVALRA